MITTIILSVLLVISVALNAVAIFLLLKLQKKLEEVSNAVEESLDILDESHQRIWQLSKTPVASDDPVIRQVVANVRRSLESIHIVAVKMAIPFNGVEEGDENEK